MDELFSQITGFRAQLEKLLDYLTTKNLLTGDEAAALPLLFKVWKPGTQAEPADYPADGTFWRDPFNGRLYKVKPGMGHKSYGDKNYAPSRAPSLWEGVAEPGEDGSREHPINYAPDMVIHNGLYYLENGILYLCIRDSGVPLYTALANVVENYVQIVE